MSPRSVWVVVAISLVGTGCGRESPIDSTPAVPGGEFANVSTPCPPGFTAYQCAVMALAAAELLSHPDNICQQGAQTFNDQLNGDYATRGVKFEVTTNPDLWGASYPVSGTTNQYHDWTGLTQKAFDNSFTDLKRTIMHEIIGHQNHGYGGSAEHEGYSEMWGEYCAGVS